MTYMIGSTGGESVIARGKQIRGYSRISSMHDVSSPRIGRTRPPRASGFDILSSRNPSDNRFTDAYPRIRQRPAVQQIAERYDASAFTPDVEQALACGVEEFNRDFAAF